MPVTQIVTTTGRSTVPVARGSITFNNSSSNWGTTNGNTYGPYTYPDSSTGQIHSLTGAEYLLTGNLGSIAGSIAINLWFYPTANNTVLMNEQDTGDESPGYHYTMLEINSSNYLRGRIWPMGPVAALTSPTTVNLNAWNHVYMTYDNGSNTVLMYLNSESTSVSATVTRTAPSSTFIGIGTSDLTQIETGSRYSGKFDDLRISTLGQSSTYNATKAKYGF
jgi:hypothetical protein